MCTDFMCQIIQLNVVVLTSSSRNLASVMCTDFMCQIFWLNVFILTSSSRNLALGIGSYFSCQILGLNVVVQSSSSGYFASVMCTDTMVSDTGTQSSSTDI